MKTSNIFKYLLIVIIFYIISLQSVSASLKDTRNDIFKPCDDWQHTNVFLISHGYGFDSMIDKQIRFPICFKKNVNLSISYSGFLNWPGLKAWDSTGLIKDFNNYGFNINIKNFTGIIIYRDGIFRERWNLYGYCSILQIHTPDY